MGINLTIPNFPPQTNKQAIANNNYYNQSGNSNTLSQVAEKLCQAAYLTITQGLLLIVGVIFCSVEIGSKQIMWSARLKLSIFTVSSSQITALLNSNNYSYNSYILQGKDYMYNNSLLSDQSLNKRELDQELYNYITTNNDQPFSKLIWIYNVKSDNW